MAKVTLVHHGPHISEKIGRDVLSKVSRYCVYVVVGSGSMQEGVLRPVQYWQTKLLQWDNLLAAAKELIECQEKQL